MRVGMVRTAAGEPSVAVGREGGWVPLLTVRGGDRLGAAAADLLTFLGGGEQVRALAEELVSAKASETSEADRAYGVAEVSGVSGTAGLLAPPWRPVAFRDCSLWEEHMIAASRGLLRLRESAAGAVSDGYERLTRRPFPRLRPRPLWHEQPLYYKGNPATIIGDGGTVRWPAYAQALDYELEIGVVIARDGTDLTPDEALTVLGGFVLVNDFSARDVQFREMIEGVEDGRIWRWPAGFGRDGAGRDPAGLFADTHGRPLGLEVDPRDGTLIVCDAYRGLLRVTETGQVRVLADSYGGRRLKFTNNAAVAADGTVYFSDSSTRFRLEHYKQDLLEHRPNGRVFRYHPSAAGLDLVADGLYFPNGVALAPDESFLLVAQTGGYDVVRIPLTGPAAGRPATFAAGLPGIPDNMSGAGDGSYWIAFPSPRLPLVDRLMPHPAPRRVAARLPERLQPAAQRYGLVARLGADGQITQSLHGPSGSYREIVGVRQHDGWLYLGSLAETAVGRVPVPA